MTEDHFIHLQAKFSVQGLSEYDEQYLIEHCQFLRFQAEQKDAYIAKLRQEHKAAKKDASELRSFLHNFEHATKLEREEFNLEIARLRKIIDDAPHNEDCDFVNQPAEWMRNKYPEKHCNCWKKEAK